MAEKYLEAGVIVNTHGLKGEVRIQPWTDTPEFLTGIERFFISGVPIRVLSARVHKSCVIAELEGVSDVDAAIKLKNKTILIDRDDAPLSEGRYFVVDLIGLRAIDGQTGEGLGVISEVLSLPSNNVYVISGVREMLVPAIPEFVVELNVESGFVRINVIEGM